MSKKSCQLFSKNCQNFQTTKLGKKKTLSQTFQSNKPHGTTKVSLWNKVMTSSKLKVGWGCKYQVQDCNAPHGKISNKCVCMAPTSPPFLMLM